MWWTPRPARPRARRAPRRSARCAAAAAWPPAFLQLLPLGRCARALEPGKPPAPLIMHTAIGSLLACRPLHGHPLPNTPFERRHRSRAPVPPGTCLTVCMHRHVRVCVAGARQGVQQLQGLSGQGHHQPGHPARLDHAALHHAAGRWRGAGWLAVGCHMQMASRPANRSWSPCSLAGWRAGQHGVASHAACVPSRAFCRLLAGAEHG